MALLLWLLPPFVQSVDLFEIRLQRLTGSGWQLSDARLEIIWQEGDRAAFTLSIAHFIHPLLQRPLRDLQLKCREGIVSDQEISCSQGTLRLHHPVLEKRRFPLRFQWSPVTTRLSLEVKGLAVAGGQLGLQLQHDPGGWNVQLTGRQLILGRLLPLAAQFGLTLDGWTLGGRTDLDLQLQGEREGLKRASWRLDFSAVGFSDPTETYLGEGLTGSWRGRAQVRKTAYSGDQQLSLTGGAILLPWVYVAPEGKMIQLSADYRISPRSHEISLTKVTYKHPEIVSMEAELALQVNRTGGTPALRIETRHLDLGRFYDAYLKPVMAGPFFDQLRLSGKAMVAMTRRHDRTSLQLKLHEAGLQLGDETAEKLFLHGIDGDLQWDSRVPAVPGTLSWRGGRLLRGIEFGPATARLQLLPDGGVLDRPLALPVLDGRLQVEDFSLSLKDSGPDLRFSGYLTPISMARISQALDWPPLAGQLSGMIPGVGYQNGELAVDGVILIRMFNGRFLLRNLRLRDLFGPLPVLTADIEIHDLDLETLTRTFVFGKITGRLAGTVRGLRLEDWHPVSFTASFHTPENDPGPHRISQKAVDNISNLGGAGISGALSRSFLRMFDTFGYDRLGISCKLHDGICNMGGIAPAEQGYYLVKGGGIPRIDIVGFNRRTDWNILLDKLQQMTEVKKPVVE